MRTQFQIAVLGFALSAAVAGAAPAPPHRDSLPGVELSYEQIKNPVSGLSQRVILSRPAGSTSRLPAVFFIPWLSCDSTSVPEARRGAIETLLYRVVATPGLVMMRVEKPGVGESEGDCSKTDLETEMAGNRAAFAALRAHAWVDATRIVAMGQSFAGGLLPLVAPPDEVRGYLFINSWSRTWMERLLEFERLRLEGKGLGPGAVAERMRGKTEIYGLVLEGGLTPAEAIRRKPALAEAWEDEPEHQYGRPIAFMQQLQATNVAAAWEKVDRPTLVVFGEADIVMHRQDHERVVAMVNRNRPGAARLLTAPGMDHGMNAPLPGGKRGLPEPLAAAIVGWLRETAGAR
jgi:pimeloyl-ACP methyl ester carboxylesterase